MDFAERGRESGSDTSVRSGRLWETIWLWRMLSDVPGQQDYEHVSIWESWPDRHSDRHPVWVGAGEHTAAPGVCILSLPL